MLSKRSSSEAPEATARRVHPFFNRTLFFKNVTRFWPIWLCYTVIWAFCLPVQIFVEMVQIDRYGWSLSELSIIADYSILRLTCDCGVLLSLAFGLLAAMAVFSYLFNARSTGLMHTLPIRREGLFFTNYLSGLCFLLVPNLLIALLTLWAESAAGILNGWNVVLWLLIQSGTAFFFYTFAVFCGMFTGHIIALPTFFGILNFLAYALYHLAEIILDMFVFGYSTSSAAYNIAEWFTPVIKLMDHLRFRSVLENGVEVQLFTGFQYVLAYCGVAVILLIAALFLYDGRHMETAGDVIAVERAKPLFKFGFAFCAALCGGLLLYYTFSSLFDSETVFFIVACVPCGIIGCFVAEMLLQKSFKVFRKGWLSCGIFSVCVVLLLTGLSCDVFGIESRVPAPGRVTSVYIHGTSLPPYDSGDNTSRSSEDPAVIEQVIALHQGIVNDRAFYKAFDRRSALWRTDTDPVWEYQSCVIRYTMADGSTLSRQYYIPFNVSSDTPDPDTVEGIFLALMNNPEALLDCYFPDESLKASPITASLSVYNTGTRAFEEVTFDAQEAALLAEAAREDILAGRLGIRYLSDESEGRRDNCSYQDLRMEWYYTVEKVSTASGGEVTLPSSQSTSRTWTCIITPQRTAASLMAALHELGALDETHILLTHGEMDGKYAPEESEPWVGLAATELYGS